MKTYDKITAAFAAERERIFRLQERRESLAAAVIETVMRQHLGVPDDRWGYWDPNDFEESDVMAATSYDRNDWGPEMRVATWLILPDGDNPLRLIIRFRFWEWSDTTEFPLLAAPAIGARERGLRGSDPESVRELAADLADGLEIFVRSNRVHDIKSVPEEVAYEPFSRA